MKKWILPIILLVVILFWALNVNNSAVDLQEETKESWGNVESSYQRRNDLIGNLVKIVQGAADFERATLTEVIEARAKATSTTINMNASNLTAENMAAFQKAQSGLSSALSRLLVTVERYPDLKSNQNFLELQSQLEGTENRINITRDRFNEDVKPYNQYVRKMPRKLIASLMGFTELAYYKSDVGSENASDTDFDFK